MLAAGVVADHEFDFLAGLAIDGCCRRCTRCLGWPKWPYLDARHFVCGGAVVVHFVGRSSADELVRSMLVVPVEMTDQFSSHVFSSQWNDDSACALVFERADETFDNSDAAMFANGSKTRLDALTLAPSLECVASELRALVADDVLWFGLCPQAAEEGANLDGSGLLLEYSGPHC